jgi:hypothetical protein
MLDASQEGAVYAFSRHPSQQQPYSLIGLLAVQLIVGYEWLMSGVTKIVRGDFPSGLAGELREKSEGMSGWYKSFLASSSPISIRYPNALVFDGTVIPLAMAWMMSGHGHGGHHHADNGHEPHAANSSLTDLHRQRNELDRLIDEREQAEREPTAEPKR